MNVLVAVFVTMEFIGGNDDDSDVDGLLDGGDVCRTVNDRIGGGVCDDGFLRLI